MEDDEIEEEIKEKQAYLKNSSYVEIQIEAEDEEAGDFFKHGEDTHFVPSVKKPTVRASEVGCNTND